MTTKTVDNNTYSTSTIYPNPTIDNAAKILFQNQIIGRIEVFDISGRKIQNHEIENLTNFTLSNLQYGMNIIMIHHQDGSIETKKLINN